MADTVLTYDHVSVSYNGREVIHDVSFSLKEGEILGIVGESGSGKSTLIRAAMQLLGNDGIVSDGDIWYRGHDLPDLDRESMRKICGTGLGMIFQNASASFCPIRKIGDQIYECAREHGRISKEECRGLASRTLERFGFSDSRSVLASYPFELSGGMSQRVAVCTAMMLKPEVLFADEPTSALDVVSQKLVMEKMRKARDVYRTAIVLVTHNIGVVRKLADTVLVLRNGVIREAGPAAEVLANPQDSYTKRLLQAVPHLRK